MKKFLLLSLVAFGSMLISNRGQAQSNWEAGIRIANNISADFTIPIAAAPRLHVPLYFERFGTGALFDWMFTLDGGPTGLKFYPGVGAEMFFETQFDLQIAGDFGVEYSFDFPLTLAVDWRPALRVTNTTGFISDNWGFIARFRFGEGTSFSRAN